MDAPSLARELESRKFTPFTKLDHLASHVSSAYVRRGDINDLVLVVDTTDPEAGPADAMAPHRVSRRLGPFSAPLDDVVRLSRATPASFFGPLSRITVVELGAAPPSPEDRRRLAAYVTPKRGQALVGAVHVDVEHKALYANDGLAPSRTGVRQSDDPLRWLEALFGTTIEVEADRANLDPVALFGPRAVAAATFLGSPIAGATLLGWNLHRTRRTRLGLALFAATIVAMAVLAGIASLAGGGLARLLTPAITIGGLFFFSKLTRSLFGDPVRKASPLLAVLLSVAGFASFLVVIAIPLVGVDMLSERETTTVNGSKVVFDRQTTEESAAKVGALLQERGVLAGPTSGLILRTKGAEHEILLTFDDRHAHEAPGVEELYRGIARELSLGVFGGEVVSVVFQTDLGTELARVSSR